MESCIVCVEKHIGMAVGYLQEAAAGYEGRLGKALGQLALAEEECITRYPQLSGSIRAVRKGLEAQRRAQPGILDHILIQIEKIIADTDPSLRKQSPTDHVKVLEPPLEEGDCDPACEERRRLIADRKAQAAARRHVQAQLEPQGPQTIRRMPEAVSDEEIDPDAPKPVLVLMTALADFHPGYSLVTVIKDQARAAVMAGYEVRLVGVNGMSQDRPKLPDVTFDPIIPALPWKEDEVDDKKVKMIEDAIRNYIKELPESREVIIITHDFLLQTWYICVAKALHKIGDWFDDDVKWFHQLHSSVGARPTAPGTKWRCTLPESHKIAAVNYTDIPHLAEYYKTETDNIITIPNIRDPADFWGFSEEAATIARVTRIAEADVAQVYPISTPRAFAKGLDKVMHLFRILKEECGQKVCLVMANAHANGNLPMLKNLKQMAKELNLEQEFHITSDLVADTRPQGLLMQEISALMSLSNLFAFPSQSEACGLVMLEAALAGCLLVLSNDLPVMKDFIQPHEALWAPWGSIHQNRPVPPETWKHLAETIVETLRHGANPAKRRVLARGPRYLAQELARLRQM